MKHKLTTKRKFRRIIFHFRTGTFILLTPNTLHISFNISEIDSRLSTAKNMASLKAKTTRIIFCAKHTRKFLVVLTLVIAHMLRTMCAPHCVQESQNLNQN